MTSLEQSSTALSRSKGATFLLIPWASPSTEQLVLCPTPSYVVCVTDPSLALFLAFCVRPWSLPPKSSLPMTPCSWCRLACPPLLKLRRRLPRTCPNLTINIPGCARWASTSPLLPSRRASTMMAIGVSQLVSRSASMVLTVDASIFNFVGIVYWHAISTLWSSRVSMSVALRRHDCARTSLPRLVLSPSIGIVPPPWCLP